MDATGKKVEHLGVAGHGGIGICRLSTLDDTQPRPPPRMGCETRERRSAPAKLGSLEHWPT